VTAPVPVDVGRLPEHAFGSRGVVWWGVMSFIAIEATMLALAMGAYGYLYINAGGSEWPPGRLPPAWQWPTVNLALLLASLAPAWWSDRAAKRYDAGSVSAALVLCCVVGAAFCAVRLLEFRALNTTWDRNAYSSVVWTLLGLHTIHLVAEVVETMVITLWVLRGARHQRTFVDVSDNALYWYFIVASWVPVYGLIIWFPRLVG
jgi:cytochrome c oxidase subunit I+III